MEVAWLFDIVHKIPYNNNHLAGTDRQIGGRELRTTSSLEEIPMAIKHPATQHHLNAAEHHTKAAASHALAAVHHEAGDNPTAKRHATEAHAHSTTAHTHSTTARDASHK